MLTCKKAYRPFQESARVIGKNTQQLGMAVRLKLRCPYKKSHQPKWKREERKACVIIVMKNGNLDTSVKDSNYS